MIILEATALDAGELQSVMAKCSQGSDIAITVVNHPDFFVRANGYESSAVFVAEDQGEIAGSAACAIRDQIVDGKIWRVGYEFQCFTSPDRHRKGVARTLHRAIEACMIAQGATMSTLVNMDANQAAAGLFESERFRFYGPLTCHFMSTYQHEDLCDSGAVRPASLRDYPTIARLLNRTWSGHNFLEPVTAADLARFTEQSPAFNRDDLLILEEDGEIVATAGIWDWSRVIQIESAAVPRRLHAKFLATEDVGWVNPMLRFVCPGKTLRQWHLAPIGFHEPRHMTTLLRTINNKAVEHGIEQVAVVFKRRSEVEQAFPTLAGQGHPLTFHVKVFDGDWPEAAAPVHFEVVDL